MSNGSDGVPLTPYDAERAKLEHLSQGEEGDALKYYQRKIKAVDEKREIWLAGWKAQLAASEALLRRILYHDERGQGVGYAEAMADTRAYLAALTPRANHRTEPVPGASSNDDVRIGVHEVTLHEGESPPRATTLTPRATVAQTCPLCNGQCAVLTQLTTGNNEPVWMTCPTCNGTGTLAQGEVRG